MSLNKVPWISVEKYAGINGLEPDHVAACLMTESNGEQFSMRYEPFYKYTVNPRIWAEKLGISFETEEVLQKSSFGLMHFMGGVARELGYEGLLPELFDVQLNLKYGTMKLKQLTQKYGDIYDVISAYNQGSPKKTPGGMYQNQKHVDRFDYWLRKIKEGH